MTDRTRFTTTDILSAAKSTLMVHGFTQVTLYHLDGIDLSNQSLFEDPYSLVAIVIFETWADLVRKWSEVQASFVDLISTHIASDERKAWDCYLLLWTPDLVPLAQMEERQSIRYDTGRVRKLIASGDDFRDLTDVETALLPLIPIIDVASASAEDNVLQRLPRLLETQELPQDIIRAVVEAFDHRESLVEAIHNLRGAG